MVKKFELLEWDWARVSHVYSFHKQNIHGAEWGIKGHNRPWIISQGQWKKGLRFLDVGAGYSDVAAHLVNTYQMEGWVADDFGTSSGEKLWSRWGNPDDLTKKHPNVRYIFKRVGEADAWRELPQAYFDRIYSISTLEHISPEKLYNVFTHMSAMLKPGGIMLHAVDIPFDIPFPKSLSSYSSLRGMISSIWHLLGHWHITRIILGKKDKFPITAKGWAHFLKKTLNITSMRTITHSNPFLSPALDPDILVEPIDIVFNFYPPNNEPKPYTRTGSLLFVLKSIE